jgi:carboxylesterase
MASGRIRRVVKRAAVTLGATFGILLLVAVLVALWPMSTAGLEAATASPASTYDEAVDQFNDWASEETDLGVFEPCRSGLYTTGKPTDVSVVLLHGLTNCPRQFQEMATELQSDGYNVVVLRAPEHGLADSSGDSIGDVSLVSDFTAQDLIDWTDASVDIASGLGDKVRVLGLSMGGTAAAWAAQFRDVDRAVTVAPALALARLPGFVDQPFANFFARVPPISIRVAGDLDHSYAGENTRAAAEMLLLGRAVQDEAATTGPMTGDITVITNDADEQVRNDDIAMLADAWSNRGADVRTFAFPSSLGLVHDIVDAQQPKQQTDVTWPLLIASLEGGADEQLAIDQTD